MPPHLQEILCELGWVAFEGQCTRIDNDVLPYVKCKSCKAAHAINKAGEILRDAWRELQEPGGKKR